MAEFYMKMNIISEIALRKKVKTKTNQMQLTSGTMT